MANKPFEYEVSLIDLSIENSKQDDFRDALSKIPYLLYKVEESSSGDIIAINKPGGKRSFGKLCRNDIMVFIYHPSTKKLWLISHAEILDDLKLKNSVDEINTKQIIRGLYRVCSGEEPDYIIKDMKLNDIRINDELIGLHVETLFKVYKWIWGQEDCNYPKGKGRWLSMESILDEFNVNK